MIPRELELAGLHSYRDPVTVDFDRAVGDGLFGIFGPTGSGKSTLLDAMTMALYGVVDRLGGRDKTPMMHVDADELSVTYTFELGDTTYRAHRRMVRSSDGSATQRDAELRDLDAGETLASQPTEVTEAVEGLLGMGFDKFTRAVFLPQGKFARFLQDTPKNRLELLEEIFGLDRYGDRLRERARDRRDAVRQRHDKLEGTLDELGDVSEETVTELASQAEAIADTVEDLADQESELAERAEAARQLAATLDALDEARETLDQLQEQEDAIDAKRERLEAAEAARAPHGTLTELEEARENLDEVTEAIEAVDEELDQRRTELEEARERREDRGEALDEREDELDEARSRLDRLDARAQRLDALRERRDEAEATLEEVDRSRTEPPPEDVLDEHTADELLATIQDAQRARDKVERARDELERALRARGEARLAVIEHGQTREELEAEVDALEQRLETVEERLHEARVADEASTLVTELGTDEPCPVCGSREHPDPAEPPETPIGELEAEEEGLETELGEARGDLAKVEGALETQTANRADALADAEEARERLQAARGALDEHVDALPEPLEGRSLEEARSAVRAWTRAVQVREAEATVDEVEQRLDEARQRFAQVRETLDLDADEPTPAAIETARSRLDEALGDVARERERLDEQVEEIEEGVDELEKRRSRLSGQAEDRAERVDALEARFAEELDGSPFDGPQAVRQAHEPEEALARLEARIEDHEDELDAAEAEVERLEAEVDEAEVDPDEAEAIVEEHEETKRRLGDAQKRLGEVESQLENERDRLERKRELAETLDELDEALERAQRLTKLLSGRKFVEFLARNRFDQVLTQASRRLSAISGGQYRLEGSPSEIRVVDHMAGGEARDLRTLSGGETFMVSLSLALALSDAIQHERGGGYPPIEFFFLDEGFGSLDQDTLDQVMRMLHELVEQDLCVGLITHVEDAKRYVPRQVVVEPATEERGSRVEVRA